MPKSGLSEDQQQRMVVKWGQQPEVRARYPELKLLHHIPNERFCTPQQGRLLKLMGVRAGVPDLCLPVPRGKYHGLYLEMKTETGRATEDQKWWGEQLLAQGYLWQVCRGWQSAVQLLQWYLELKEGRQ